MSKALFLFLLSISICSNSFSRELEFMGKLNAGVGFDYRELDYFGNSVAYSPGGGMGIELGLIFPFNLFESYGTLGYQQNLALQYENSRYGGTSKSSFSFNKKFISDDISIAIIKKIN